MNQMQNIQSGSAELKNVYDPGVAKEALRRKREKMAAKVEASRLGVDPNAVQMFNQIKK